MIELKSYKVPLRYSLYPTDIRGIREIYDGNRRIRKHTQIQVFDSWVSVEGSYESIKELINDKPDKIGYK